MHRCTLAAAGEGAPAGAVLWTAGGLVAGTAALPPEIVAAFVHGAVYEVRVAATSHAGLTAEAAADFTVDLTPPTIAPLRVASAGGGGIAVSERQSCWALRMATIFFAKWARAITSVAALSVMPCERGVECETRWWWSNRS